MICSDLHVFYNVFFSEDHQNMLKLYQHQKKEGIRGGVSSNIVLLVYVMLFLLVPIGFTMGLFFLE